MSLTNKLTRCASLVGKELREAKRGEPDLLAEIDGHGVAQHFAQPARGEVPAITCPNPLGPVALGYLGDHCLDPAALSHQPAWPALSFPFLGLVRGQQAQPLLCEPFGELGAPVVPVAQDPALLLRLLEQFLGQAQVMDVGGCQFHLDDHPGPAHPEVGTQPVEGLLAHLVVAEGALFSQDAAAVSPREMASRHREAVDQGHLGVEAHPAEQVLPEHLLYDPEIGRLAAEGGAVNSLEGRKPFAVVSAEVAVDTFVGVDAEELPYYFYGEDLCIGELRSRTAPADATLLLEPVVDEAEDGYDEGAKIHKKTSVTLGAIGLTPSVGRSSPWLNTSREKLAHGVSWPPPSDPRSPAPRDRQLSAADPCRGSRRPHLRGQRPFW